MTPEGLCTKCSATQYCSEHEPAPGCNICKAEEWHRDGRGLWAMRACTGIAKHGGSHSFSAWRCYVQPPGEQQEQYNAAVAGWLADRVNELLAEFRDQLRWLDRGSERYSRVVALIAKAEAKPTGVQQD